MAAGECTRGVFAIDKEKEASGEPHCGVLPEGGMSGLHSETSVPLHVGEGKRGEGGSCLQSTKENFWPLRRVA